MQGSFAAARSVETQLSAGSLRACSVKETLENQPPVLRIDECLSPASIDSVVLAERDSKSGKFASASPIDSVDCLEADQVSLVVTDSSYDVPELNTNCIMFTSFVFVFKQSVKF